ncbi:hypothetical protein Sjap_003353 [Stephania japonica]|uniref:Uncharacterized protein n=1 Tax=Stephania japonica TaxID=461633 RepID=A0AAP0PTG6_9MAGN
MEAQRGSHLGINGINFIPLRGANIVVGGIAVRLSEKDDVKTSKTKKVILGMKSYEIIASFLKTILPGWNDEF